MIVVEVAAEVIREEEIDAALVVLAEAFPEVLPKVALMSAAARERLDVVVAVVGGAGDLQFEAVESAAVVAAAAVCDAWAGARGGEGN